VRGTNETSPWKVRKLTIIDLGKFGELPRANLSKFGKLRKLTMDN
jgi:hypothetical protein